MSRKPCSTSSIAVGYVRVSTEEQALEGVSLAAQEAALRAYCTLRGFELVDLIREEGVSAGIPLAERKGGAKISELVTSGKASHVIALKLDRLFRDASDCLAVTARWDKTGVALHLTDLGGQAIDTSTAMGRFFLTVMAGAAEMERNLIKERTRTALAHKAKQGERVGQIPFGYQLGSDNIHIEANPNEQATLIQIRTMYSAAISPGAIAERLNEIGTPARGTRWHRNTVRRILARETV
jgi:site-specific DNA recombinase